jgi:hypothetical protein
LIFHNLFHLGFRLMWLMLDNESIIWFYIFFSSSRNVVGFVVASDREFQ